MFKEYLIEYIDYGIEDETIIMEESLESAIKAFRYKHGNKAQVQRVYENSKFGWTQISCSMYEHLII